MDWRFITRRSAVLAAIAGAGAALAAPAGALAAGGSPVYASGSSFQNSAHGVWKGKYAANTKLDAAPAITYTSSSSGKGLSVFGNDDGSLKAAADTGAPSGVLDGFIGTDDPPTAGQLNLAKLASGASELTIPVAQAPVAVLLSLPVGVTIDDGEVDLLNVYLERAVAGTLPAAGGYDANTWGALLTANGTSFSEDNSDDANVPITVQVRVGGSGTSFAFKNYLNQIATDSTNPVTTDAGVWTNFLTGDQAWPATARVSDGGASNSGGGALVKSTASNPGSLGYANLADAVSSGNGGFTSTATASTFGSSASHQIVYALLQNNGSATSGATFAEASGDTGNLINAQGNCTTSAGTVKGWTKAPSDPRASWIGVLASDTNIAADAGPAFYPACAVTYEAAWDNYNAAGLAPGYTNVAAGITPQGTFQSVRDYLGYITSAQGQADVEAKGYNRLPDAIETKARAAVAAIAFKTAPSNGGDDGNNNGNNNGNNGGNNGGKDDGGGDKTPAHDTSATNLRPKLTASASALTIALSCPSTKASCTAKVQAKATIKVKQGRKTIKKTIVVASGKTTLAGGKSKKLTLKLSSAAKKALASQKKLTVTVTVTASDTYGGKKTTKLSATVKQPVKKKAKAKRSR